MNVKYFWENQKSHDGIRFLETQVPMEKKNGLFMKI